MLNKCIIWATTLALVGVLQGCTASDEAGQTKVAEPVAADPAQQAEQAPLGDIRNPVKCDDPGGERYYLARLVDPDGREIDFSRIGSLGNPNGGNILDGYEVTVGEEELEIYMDMYHHGYYEDKPVPGFYLRCRMTWDLLIHEDGLRYASGSDEPYHGAYTRKDEETGKIIAMAILRKGLLHGDAVTYHETGQVYRRVPFKHGAEHGLAQHFNEDGKLATTFHYQHGQRHGEGTWYRPDGTIEAVYTYTDGRPHGPHYDTHEDGSIKRKGQFKEGRADGLFIEYDQQGNVTKRELYRKGKVVEDPEAIKKETAAVIDAALKVMRDAETVDAAAVGYAGTRTATYDAYVTLRENASNDRLVTLLDDADPVVATYAFWALEDRLDQEALLPLVMKQIKNESPVELFFGSIRSTSTIGDEVLNTAKLSAEQQTIVNDYLLTTDNGLSATYSLLGSAVLPAKYYDRVRELAKRGIPDALIALSRYQREGDITIIAAGLDDEDRDFYALRAISYFPHADFMPRLVTMQDTLLAEEYWSTTQREFYTAVARYRSPEAIEILKKPFDRSLDVPMREYHIRFVKRALNHENDPYHDPVRKLYK